MLNFINILHLGLVVNLFFIRAAGLLSGIEAHRQIFGDLLLYDLHSFFDESVLLCSLDADFEVCLLGIEIPFRVLLALLQEKPLSIVLSVLEVCHVEYEMRYFFTTVVSVQADSQSGLFSLGRHAGVGVQRQHCINLELLVENCRVYILC